MGSKLSLLMVNSMASLGPRLREAFCNEGTEASPLCCSCDGTLFAFSSSRIRRVRIRFNSALRASSASLILFEHDDSEPLKLTPPDKRFLILFTNTVRALFRLCRCFSQGTMSRSGGLSFERWASAGSTGTGARGRLGVRGETCFPDVQLSDVESGEQQQRRYIMLRSDWPRNTTR